MQGELCEIPLAGVLEIICREQVETVPYRCTPQEACPALDKGKDEGNPAKRGTDGRFSTAC